MYLFIGADSQELDKSINHQLAQSELWQKLTAQNNNNSSTITSNNSSVDTGNTAQDKSWNLKSTLGLGGFPSTRTSLVKLCTILFWFVLQTVLPCEVKVRHFLLFWVVTKHSVYEVNVLTQLLVFSKCPGLSALVEKMSLSSLVPNPIAKASTRPLHRAEDSSFPDMTTKAGMQPLPMPPPLDLPQVCADGPTRSLGAHLSC